MIIFFIGTEAELIKLFPIIRECKARELKYTIIASGQNDIGKSSIFNVLERNKVELVLSKEGEIVKNAAGLLIWFCKTILKAKREIKYTYSTINLREAILVVHGDTISTLMGACLGKRMGMHVCHVEAGLRSFNYLNPFPEEVDRIITSKIATTHFAPGIIPSENLKNVKGNVIDTKYNTILDSLKYAMVEVEENFFDYIRGKYFVFVMHRQENLANRQFVLQIIEKIKISASKMQCIMILHEPTRITLEKMGILQEIEASSEIFTVPRMDYFKFMYVLNKAEYVLTDGGSNQEELFYMGKPCLILRKNTERQEGIGDNAKLFQGKMNEIDDFCENYKKYRRSTKLGENIRPSMIIVDNLQKMLKFGWYNND